ncbi:Syntaxin-18 [Caligus rogercresseyi]|uniref:Syntaxin-18 n=1 Tax=Caligus rogercresseyi TaxID=217165 RepID=A0A7T8GR82_CALRO|nr:Syntaxin-18 [Caligus rogercresseyi]
MSEFNAAYTTRFLSILCTTKLLIGKYKKDLESALNLSSQVVSHFLGVAEILERKLRVVEQVFLPQRECRIEKMKIKREMSRLEDFKSSPLAPKKEVDNFIHEEEKRMRKMNSHQRSSSFFNGKNASMFEELQRTQNEVVKIAELQELFSEKTLQQKDDIELNIKDGNEELRKMASIRAYILFSLIVLPFSLLFLDWYNP